MMWPRPSGVPSQPKPLIGSMVGARLPVAVGTTLPTASVGAAVPPPEPMPSMRKTQLPMTLYVATPRLRSPRYERRPGYHGGAGVSRADRRQVAQVAQAEGLQELLGGAVEDRPAERVVAAGDAHQA